MEQLRTVKSTAHGFNRGWNVGWRKPEARNVRRTKPRNEEGCLDEQHTAVTSVAAREAYCCKMTKFVRSANNKAMQTITVEILHKNALQLLEDLEMLRLIKLRRDKTQTVASIDWAKHYKGAMTKQPLQEIDTQLDELRNEWA